MRAARRGSVLLVDDDVTLLRTFAREFARRDWEVATAANSDEARPVARRQRPAVIVLDLMLGDKSGLDLIEPLRGESPATRIVVMTGSPSLDTAVEAMRRGAHNYVEKPCDVETLIAAAAVEPAVVAEVPSAASLAQSERAHINQVIAACNGNISEAARRLGLHRRSLQRKLRKHVPGVE